MHDNEYPPSCHRNLEVVHGVVACDPTRSPLVLLRVCGAGGSPDFGLGRRHHERRSLGLDRLGARGGARAEHRGFRSPSGGVGDAPVQVHLPRGSGHRSPPRKVS